MARPRNPNIDVPQEGTQRFQPSDRLFRQMELRGGPYLRYLQEDMEDRGYSMNIVDQPNTNLYGSTIVNDMPLEEAAELTSHSLLKKFVRDSGTDTSESAKGVYAYGQQKGDDLLGTLAHEGQHVVSDLADEEVVQGRDLFFSRTLDDVAHASDFIVSRHKNRGLTEKYKSKDERISYVEYATRVMEDNFEDYAYEAARKEAMDYAEHVEGKEAYALRANIKPTNEDVLGQLGELELRVARWTRDAEKYDEKELVRKEDVIGSLHTLQKKIRAKMHKLVEE